MMSPFDHSHRYLPLLVATAVILLISGCCGAVAADAEVAYGNTVTLHISNPAGGTTYLYIAGPNFPFTPLMDASGARITAQGKSATVEIDTADIRSANGKRPDVGTYTIYIANRDGCTSVRNLADDGGTYGTFVLTIRPIGFTAGIAPAATAEPTPVITATPTPEPTATPTPIPASPVPICAVCVGLAAAVLALRR